MGQSSKSGSAGGGGGGVVCPSTAISGCASGTALIQLDATGPGSGGAVESEHERGTWTGRFDFLLSLLGYSVGLGNVWRFPYLCYNNGGGAFLIPFTIMLVIAGLPLMFMELSFGQYAALGPVAVYRRFCPLFRGLGTGMILVSAIVMLYYNLIIAWTIFYMFASFAPVLPWAADCFSYAQADQCEATNGTYYLRTCHNATSAAENNITALALGALKRPPAEEYFNNFVLGLSKGIEETGSIKLSLAACLFLAWTIVFLCLCKGVQSSGKVVYFTALFPYVVLVILFVRGVTLPGASTGILFYLTPDWKQLANAQVWGDAAVQIFFALSPAWGGLITLSSYNKFSNNCYNTTLVTNCGTFELSTKSNSRDSLIVAFCNIATSFFAGLVIFSIIGFLAHELNVDVEKVVDQGAGLAFIVYPEVVTRLPVSPVWAVLFFVMLLTLGLDSQFALMETVTTAILDRFPNLRQYKIWVVLSVAIFGYIGGLGFTTNSGMYWLQLMDKYAANWSVLLIAISECILIAWIYGSQRFLNDIQGMIGKRSWFWNFFWGIMWRYITPATLLFILFFNWVEYKPAKYGHYVYPMWADAVGWIVGLLPVLVIFLVAFQEIWRAPKSLSFRDRIKHLLQPTAEWGPAGRPCVNLHAERYQSQNYDGVTNTKILIEEEASPKQAANKKDRQLTLDVDVDVECLPLATVGKRPGAPKSVGKQGSSGNLQTNAKNGTHKSPTTEISPSKQPLIPAEKDNKSASTKVLAAGTQSSGRECTTMSTFAGGGEKKSTKVNLATGATSAAAPLASSNITTAATVAAATKSPPAAGVAPTTLVGVAATGTTVAAAANGKATLKTTISSGAAAAPTAGGNKAASVAAATATVATGKTPAAAMALNVAASVKVSQTDKTAPLKTTISASVAAAPGGTKASTAPGVATATVVTVSSGATVPAAASKAAAPLKATAPPPSAAVSATQAAKNTPVAAPLTAALVKPIAPSAGSGKAATSGDVLSSRSTDTPPPAKGAASSNMSAKSAKAGRTQANETSPTKSAVKPIKAGSTSPTKAVVAKPGATAGKGAVASAATATAAGSSSSSKKAATSTAATLGSQAKTKGNASGAGTKK
ncbi:GD11799 [Drosophila simulans]|uniref:Transporter n=1 Tax=Drosophila simulans TaxID=7240 RepID=B4QB00_DROSI|nr:GD11799 [Drosophila simulans]